MDRGKKCRQFKLLTWTSFVGQFVHPVGGWGKRDRMGVGSLFQQATNLTLLEYVIIWCRVQ